MGKSQPMPPVAERLFHLTGTSRESVPSESQEGGIVTAIRRRSLEVKRNVLADGEASAQR